MHHGCGCAHAPYGVRLWRVGVARETHRTDSYEMPHMPHRVSPRPEGPGTRQGILPERTIASTRAIHASTILSSFRCVCGPVGSRPCSHLEPASCSAGRTHHLLAHDCGRIQSIETMGARWNLLNLRARVTAGQDGGHGLETGPGRRRQQLAPHQKPAVTP